MSNSFFFISLTCPTTLPSNADIMPLIDLLGIQRSKVYADVSDVLIKELVKKIAMLRPKQLQTLLDASFSYISIEVLNFKKKNACTL